jgi:hypothetical protein
MFLENKDDQNLLRWGKVMKRKIRTDKNRVYLSAQRQYLLPLGRFIQVISSHHISTTWKNTLIVANFCNPQPLLVRRLHSPI